MKKSISVSVTNEGTLYKAYWNKLVCAGRAAEGLRNGWQRQLSRIQQEIGFSYIRFHGIFHDDMMVYTELPNGSVAYNWHYVDELFDFLLSVGIRPFVELGFMPTDLRSGSATCFWWKGNITPPKSDVAWTSLVSEFIVHCMHRYGEEEVLQWYFEVWNEPNLYEYFWHATQEEYFHLYAITAKTIKNIHPSLRVGGPATSNFAQGEAPWMRDFLDFCAQETIPLDFITSHPYPNHWPLDPETGKRRVAYRDPDATSKDTLWLKELIQASAFKEAEIHITEWNSSFVPWDVVHDTAFMGPFIVQNAVKSLGNVHSLGFWTFTDIFEETRAGDDVFHGGFGMMSYRGIPKPSFYAYAFLSRLGEQLVDQGDEYIITRNDTGMQILCWNYSHYKPEYRVAGQYDPKPADPYGAFVTGESKDIHIHLTGLQKGVKLHVSCSMVSPTHGSAYEIWRDWGADPYPSAALYKALQESAVPSTWTLTVDSENPELVLQNVEAHALVLIQLQTTQTGVSV